MTLPIAPPPASLDSVDNLIKLILNVDVAAKLVKDLKAAAEDHANALKELAVANSEASEKLAKLEKQEANVASKQAKLDLLKAELDVKRNESAATEAGLAEAWDKYNARIKEFEAELAAKNQELANLEAAAKAAVEQAEADKAEAARFKNEIADRLQAVKAAAAGV